MTQPPTHLILDVDGKRRLYRLADVELTDQTRHDMEAHGARVADVVDVAAISRAAQRQATAELSGIAR